LATFVLTVFLTTLLPAVSWAAASPGAEEVKALIDKVAAYQFANVPDPAVNSVGGEWTVMCLARSGHITDAYKQKYLANLEAYVKEAEGVLHDKKYTEYSRVILALSAIGVNAHDIAGYDLVAPLADYDKVIWQGENGPIWALIALDTWGYAVPALPAGSKATQATRDDLIARILERQSPQDGLWRLTNGKKNDYTGTMTSDMSGMALQSLAPYYGTRADVKAAVDRGLDALSKLQGGESAGYGSSESDVQVIVALNALGVPLTDPRFVKSDKTLYDSLMTYYVDGEDGTASFKHDAAGGGVSGMSTDQGMYALISLYRALTSAKTLYDMRDAPGYNGDPDPQEEEEEQEQEEEKVEDDTQKDVVAVTPEIAENEADEGEAPPDSADNKLKKITLSAGKLSPKFKAATESYKLKLSAKRASVKIKPVKSDAKAKLQIKAGDGRYKTATGVTVKLMKGRSRTVAIKVIAESGAAKVYRIKVTRARK
jgi:hypothetical protein